MLRPVSFVACAACVACACLALIGCTRTDPVDIAAQRGVTVTAEERTLLQQLARDPFHRILWIDRDDEQRLLVRTQQGNDQASYLLMPGHDGTTVLAIRRVGDEQMLPTTIDDRVGTGPEPRGVSRP
jgi:hypothetical protein